jgi:Tfp pilus assembly protein PilW
VITLRRLRDDRGTSLTELLVVMLILSFIVITTTSLTIGMHRTTAETISRQDQVDMGRSAVERMSKTLRTAVKPSQLLSNCAGCTEDAFIRAQDLGVQFYANLDNTGNSVGPSRISYVVATTGADAGVLIEKVQVPDSNVPTATGYTYCDAESPGASASCQARLTTTRLAEGVQTDTGTPLFAYYDNDGNLMSTGSTGLDASELNRLLSVEMVLTIQSTNTTKPHPTTYIQRILLPNTQAVLRPW